MSEITKYQLLSPISAGEREDLIDGKSPDDGVRRIQALLADWLRMENVVVLTAAGCSFGAGGRLMAGPKRNNLECLVLDTIEKSSSLSDKARAVLLHRKSTWPEGENPGPVGFEDWLSYLFNASGMTASDMSPVKKVVWKGDVPKGEEGSLVLADGDLAELRGLVEKAIFGECALLCTAVTN